jgi:precorrin-2 dehydrogenase/sirohydrochlorin ferrochelatase
MSSSDSDDLRIKQIGGGSLLIAWQLKDKNVLIVGGGEVAAQRLESILTADANITLLSPEKGLNPRTTRIITLRKDHITHHDRLFQGPEELDNMDMVLTAIDDNELSHKIVIMCRERRIPVNAADIPSLCDFYFGAQIRDGPLQVMISTNGNGPRMAALIKDRLQRGLSGSEGEAIVKVGQLRNKLRERAPGVGGPLGQERMKWITKLCNQWEMEDFTSLDETMMDSLLDEGWEKGRHVPTVQEVGGRPKERKAIGFQFLPLAAAFLVGAITTGLLRVYQQRR